MSIVVVFRRNTDRQTDLCAVPEGTSRDTVRQEKVKVKVTLQQATKVQRESTGVVILFL
jgi:hypothetical protein